ncbi:DUF899 domain-containing protein [Algoriphagus aestuariicola]|uniref:DUF899 domain-containing protein n=1 Tax=Algoriphagus aestuariicola TaxID=1852016 RepID=A0ABS3BQ88_9BACT|nr:DUF899 domain-containing protein [Algoriphagus aestuariicola]MBN7801230.1 DUF899 domain-containing protein [Algoriphagus aestuariicola]
MENWAIPKIVSRSQWLDERKSLLEKEKAATKLLDATRAARRRMPMVKVEKEYLFEGPEGELSLLEMFKGRRQLIVHHFMYFDDTSKFCPGCSLEASQNYSLILQEKLHKKSVTLAAVSRAPLKRIEEEKAKNHWDFPFYSSQKSDFNYDFQATVDPKRNMEYNYQGIELKSLKDYAGDLPAKSVFLRVADKVYHTYSAFARGTEMVATHFNYLDMTPYGRQESWEDSPEGWPQNQYYG